MAPKQAKRRVAEGDLSVAGVVEIRAHETSVPWSEIPISKTQLHPARPPYPRF